MEARSMERLAADLSPPHEVRDWGRFDAIVESMRDVGWVGEPIAIVADENLRAITGSHRIAAASYVGIEIPTIEVAVGDLDEACRAWAEMLEGDLSDDALQMAPDTLPAEFRRVVLMETRK